MRELVPGDVIRLRRSKDFKRPLYHKTVDEINRCRQTRYFRSNVLPHSNWYIYSILYLVVEVETDQKVHVCRLDRHVSYRVSPYTWVSMGYLQGGTIVREGVDVSFVKDKKHPMWGYQGCVSKPKFLLQAPTSNGQSCG